MVVRIEGLERKQPDDPVLEDRGFIASDPHPQGAYIDHVKLAVYGCSCSFCIQELTARDTSRFRL